MKSILSHIKKNSNEKNSNDSMMTPGLPSTTLGQTDLKIAKVAHGLMLMTWKDPVVDDETAFEAIKAGMDLLSPNERILHSTAEFYGIDPVTANLELLSRFFAKYPDYVNKSFLSVKGGSVKGGLQPDCSPENLRRSVVDCQASLGTTKKMDMFTPSRMDGNNSIEEVVTTLKALRDEGLFEYIGLSEVNADTLRRASKIAPISVVEIEVSPWTYDPKTQEVIAAAKELNVNVAAYAPLGRGFLTGKVKREDLKEGDFRLHVPRFEAEAAAQNQKMVDELSAIAKKKGVTNAQLCIAWVASLGNQVVPLPGSSKKSRTLENFAAASITLSAEEKAELDEAVENFVIAGDRYPEYLQQSLLQ